MINGSKGSLPPETPEVVDIARDTLYLQISPLFAFLVQKIEIIISYINVYCMFVCNNANF